MSTILRAKITTAGMRAAFAANYAGLNLDLSHIAIGSSAGNGYTPTGAETMLQAEFQRVPIAGGTYLTDFEILVEALFDGTPQGWIKEFGVFTSNGTLFAIWSEPSTPLAYKSAASPLALALSLELKELPASSVNFIVGAPDMNIFLGEPWIKVAAEVMRNHRMGIAADAASLSARLPQIW